MKAVCFLLTSVLLAACAEQRAHQPVSGQSGSQDDILSVSAVGSLIVVKNAPVGVVNTSPSKVSACVEKADLLDPKRTVLITTRQGTRHIKKTQTIEAQAHKAIDPASLASVQRCVEMAL